MRYLVIALLLFVLVDPTTVHAYRTYADDPTVGQAAVHAGELRWSIVAAPMSLDDIAVLEAVAMRATQAWSHPECSGLRARFGGTAPLTSTHRDGVNSITFISAGWADHGLPADVPATTDVELALQDGIWQIVEADVLVDLETRRWRELTGAPADLSLESVLVHEFGHALGILHPCGDPGAPPCVAVPAAQESVLNPEYGPLRSLSLDDVAAVCALYPRTASHVCDECADDEVCVSDRCIPHCAEPPCLDECESDDDCPGTRYCSLSGELACVDARMRGAPCNTGSECESGRCVASSFSPGYCTDVCVSSLTCADNESCSEVEGMRVCAPNPPPTCGAAPRRGTSGSPLSWCVYLVTLVLLLQPKRPRRACRKQS